MFIIYILIALIAVLGAPLFVVIAGITIINFVFTKDSGGVQNIILEITGIANMPLLHSIPLFTLAGYLLANSKASTRLVRLTKAGLGWMPGGLAIVTIIACSVFTALTGASGVTIVALGGFLLPALLQEKYGEKYSLGLVTSSGSFGLLFPPSLPVIIFGVVASAGAQRSIGSIVSIEDLFIAGLVPGILILIVLSLHAIYVSNKQKVEKTKFSWKELFNSIKESKWELPLPIILFTGIYSGFLIISDAAIITVLYILIVEIFITKDIKIRELPRIMRESMVLVGAILIILSVSLAATNFLIYAQVPQKLFEVIRNFISNKYVFLILLNIFLLIVGCLMDIFSALVVVVPLILPIAEYYNINLIHLGIIFLANLQIGYLTPPIGMNLFIASLRFNKPVVTLYRASVVFIGLLLLSLMLITYVPDFSLWFKEKPVIVGKWEYRDKSGKIDRISIKSNGKYVRKKGTDIEILMNTPFYGEYSVKKNVLTLLADQGKEEYKYEIYNDGVKVLFENLNKNKSVEISNIDNSEDTQDQGMEFKSVDDPNKLFYKNVGNIELKENSSKFIAKWTDEKNMVSIEFYFNSTSKWLIGSEEKEFGYRVLNKNTIKFIDYSETEAVSTSSKQKNYFFYKYKFIDSNTLILQSKNNKDIKYTLKFMDSNSDN